MTPSKVIKLLSQAFPVFCLKKSKLATNNKQTGHLTKIFYLKYFHFKCTLATIIFYFSKGLQGFHMNFHYTYPTLTKPNY